MPILGCQIIFPRMKELFRNPHTFDMSNYYSGNIFVVGGIDFDKEEKESVKDIQKPASDKKTIELDWSFLKSETKKRRS